MINLPKNVTNGWIKYSMVVIALLFYLFIGTSAKFAYGTKVCVVNFYVDSTTKIFGNEPIIFGNTTAEALRLMLNETGKFSVVPLEITSKALSEIGVKASDLYETSTLIRVGDSLGVSKVVGAKINSYDQNTLSIELKVVDVRKGKVIYQETKVPQYNTLESFGNVLRNFTSEITEAIENPYTYSIGPVIYGGEFALSTLNQSVSTSVGVNGKLIIDSYNSVNLKLLYLPISGGGFGLKFSFGLISTLPIGTIIIYTGYDVIGGYIKGSINFGAGFKLGIELFLENIIPFYDGAIGILLEGNLEFGGLLGNITDFYIGYPVGAGINFYF